MSDDHSAITLRMMLAEIAPRKAAALWGTPEVISVMNKHFADAILAAKAEEREACAALALDEAGLWTSNDSNANEAWACGRVAAAIRKRGEPQP